MRSHLVLLCAVGALAACSKPAPPASNAAANTAAAAPAAPVAVMPATPAASGAPGEMPAPKAGLWQRVSSQDGGAPDTGTKCMSGKPIDPSEGGPPCSGVTVTRTPTGGFVYDAECGGGGMSGKLHMTGEGDFNQSFTTDSTMAMTGGPGGALTTKNHSVYTFKSASC